MYRIVVGVLAFSSCVAILDPSCSAAQSTAALAVPPQYTITVLSPPGYTGLTLARAINDRGDVVGETGATAFIYSSGTYTSLPPLPGAKSIPYVNGINDKGQVVGLQLMNSGEIHAYLYSNGAAMDLGTGDGSQAQAINNLGQIVGGLNNPSRGFIYSAGAVTPIPTFGGDRAYATAINDKGQVVGGSNLAVGEPTHPFLYSNGSLTDLGLLPGYVGGAAAGINQNGDIVGFLQAPLEPGGGVFPRQRAFLYHDGVMSDLGLPDLPFLYNSSAATSINDRGQIVGYLSNLPNGAFLYEDGHMYDLQKLLPASSPWTISDGAMINDSGQIVVEAVDRPGDYHGLLLTPAPEPSAAMLLAAGTVTLLWRRRVRPWECSRGASAAAA